METYKILFIAFFAVLLVVNYDLVRVYNYLSNKLFGGKKLAPKETKFN